MERSRRNWSAVRAVLAFLLICILPSTHGQVIGTDICACSPSTFTFRFDFSLTCPPVNVTKGAGTGIKETSCIVVPLDPSEDVTDTTPVLVTNIQVADYDLNNQVLSGPTNLMGEYEDGDTFTYTSAMAEGAETVEQLAGGLFMTVTGQNAAGQALNLVWSITYTNECGIEPILEVGDSAGWVVFEDFTPPRQDLCPGATTEAPTSSPVSDTDAPTSSFAPSSAAPVITEPPTVAPVTGPPTEAPVTEPPSTPPPSTVPVTPPPATEPPTPPPATNPPTPPPTTTVPVPSPPVSPPTDGPEPQPTTRPPTTPPPPTMSMSYSMSFDVRRMEEAMNEAELFEFGRAI